jgi:beta-phosphoglucomutase family hydrolase
MAQSRLNEMITKDRFDAVLFDLDGVLTDTASIHAQCWKKMFDNFLQHYETAGKGSFEPFDIVTDYKQHVDGKLRYDGVRSFLQSRGIELPQGDSGAPPNYDTVAGLGNCKDDCFKQTLESGSVIVYGGSVALVKHLRSLNIKTAVVSASKNCRKVLQAANIEPLFDVRVDGIVADRMQLAGKPAPDTFLKAAELLGVKPERTAVVEDAVSGVQAARDGGFALVIGMDQEGNPEKLKQNGADIVVKDLAVFLP